MKNKEFKWLDGYDNGLKLTKAYLAKNNIPPNKYYRAFTKVEIDFLKIDLSVLKLKYPNAIITLESYYNENKTSHQDEIEIDEDDIYNEGAFRNCILRIFDGEVFYGVEKESITILYNSEDPLVLYNKLFEVLPKKDNSPKEAEIHLVAYNNEYYTISSKIKKSDINLDENYNDDFKPVFEDVMSFLKDRKSGLIVLRGIKGTGKTSLIRHLISTVPMSYILVTNAVAEHLASPEFISFMLENKNSVFILEDCEQILMKRTDGFGANGAIANILNMSDGLMSDIFNIKFICTFNADINKIDEALLRKGRCYANYEFKPLAAKKAKVLLERLGIKDFEEKDMTLADIYNYGDNNYEEKPTKKVGF